MSYQLYRNTTLGNSLQESLDELIQVRISGCFISTGVSVKWFLLSTVSVWANYTSAGLQNYVAIRQVDEQSSDGQSEESIHVQSI